MTQPIVLACNGDFEATAAIPWLAERYGAAVVAMVLDVGQRRDPAETRARALGAGAVRAHVIDARDEFARVCLLPALRGDVIDEGGYLQVAALTGGLIARQLVDVADLEGAAAIAHGSAAMRIDAAARELRPGIRVIAPAREWNMTHAELADWARARDLPIPPSCKVRESLWGRSVCWSRSAGNETAGARPWVPSALRGAMPGEAVVEIAFDRGTPVAVNGVPMPLPDLVESLAVIAGHQGIGRIERGGEAGAALHMVHEAPAAVLLHAAYINGGRGTGTVRVKLAGGVQTVVSDLVSQP